MIGPARRRFALPFYALKGHIMNDGLVCFWDTPSRLAEAGHFLPFSLFFFWLDFIRL